MFSAMLGTLQYTTNIYTSDIKHGGSQVYVQCNVRHPAIHKTISTPPISSMVGARSMFSAMLGTLQYTKQYLHLRYQAWWEPGLCSVQC